MTELYDGFLRSHCKWGHWYRFKVLSSFFIKLVIMLVFPNPLRCKIMHLVANLVKMMAITYLKYFTYLFLLVRYVTFNIIEIKTWNIQIHVLEPWTWVCVYMCVHIFVRMCISIRVCSYACMLCAYIHACVPVRVRSLESLTSSWGCYHISATRRSCCSLLRHIQGN